MGLQFDAWLSLVFRWAHIIAGIGWIGSSFYFMALDYSLRRKEGMPESVKGENWSVHGGGFYHIQKYMVAPEEMPGDLKWFQWESYATWLTGFALLAVLYYWQADIYLIDRSVMALSKGQAIAISLATLAAAWVIYDLLCKSPLKDNQAVMFGVLFVLIVAATYGLSQIFSPRAAFLHVGAMIGTIMTGNVFFVIIPNQKIVVADLKAGRTPDARFGAIAKLRSTHNNYLTLPVIFLMISNHYPMTFGHPMNWVIVGLILPIGAIVRHYFNSHDQGKHGAAMAWQWPAAAVLLFVMMVFTAWKPAPKQDVIAGQDIAGQDQAMEQTSPQQTPPSNASPQENSQAAANTPAPTSSVTSAQAFSIIKRRCTVCHSANPTDYVGVAPGGVHYDTLDQIIQYAPQIGAQAVASAAMPPGNLTDMTDEERKLLGEWLDAGAPR